MEEIYITEEELEYYSNPISTDMLNDETVPYKPRISFEEESKGCITLEEFGKMWKDAIDNDPRFI